MKIFGKLNNKDLVKRIDYLDQKLDLIHRSVVRLRIDLPRLVHDNKVREKRERVC